MWITTSIISAICGGISTICIKCGVKNTDSNLATALRTSFVLFFSWTIIIITDSISEIYQITSGTYFFLLLSGISTGASWTFYHKALSMTNVNKVVPVDKSSTIISIILAIIIFNETSNLIIKIICTICLTAGIILMIEHNDDGNGDSSKKWLIYAVLSAIFGALSSIFAKPGFANINSNLGNAIRAVVIFIFIWIFVLSNGKHHSIKQIDRKDFLFILMSGIATGCAWVCYYYSIQNGIVSAVVPIDRLSILVSIILSRLILKEKLSAKGNAGLIIIIISTIVMAVFC